MLYGRDHLGGSANEAAHKGLSEAGKLDGREVKQVKMGEKLDDGFMMVATMVMLTGIAAIAGAVFLPLLPIGVVLVGVVGASYALGGAIALGLGIYTACRDGQRANALPPR